MGFAESGSALYPSLSITGRSAADTAGVMTYGPTRVVTGGGALTCTCSRFGDYASMQVRSRMSITRVPFDAEPTDVSTPPTLTHRSIPSTAARFSFITNTCKRPVGETGAVAWSSSASRTAPELF